MPSLTDWRTAHEEPITGTGPNESRGRDAPNARVSGIDAILPNLSFTNLFVAASRAGVGGGSTRTAHGIVRNNPLTNYTVKITYPRRGT